MARQSGKAERGSRIAFEADLAGLDGGAAAGRLAMRRIR